MYPDTLFKIFGAEIDLYVIMVLIGLIVCCVVFYLTAARKGIDRKTINTYLDLAIISIIIGFGTSILFQGFYNLIETGKFADADGAVGMTFLGGLIGGAATFILGMLFVIAKPKRAVIPQVVEIAAPCIVIAHAFGRLGCFFSGCCYGKVTDSAIGILFEGHAHKVIPTQLIEAIFLFLLFGVLMILVLKDYKFSMITYLITYGIFRFVIEFFRGDDRGALIPGLSPSQAWSLLMIIGGLVLIYFKFLHKRFFPPKETGAANTGK